MSDVFDIGGSAYNNQRKSNENYVHGRGNEWLPVDTHKDPRLSRRDKGIFLLFYFVCFLEC